MSRGGWLMPNRTRNVLVVGGSAICSLSLVVLFAGRSQDRLVFAGGFLLGSSLAVGAFGSTPTGRPSHPHCGTATYRGSTWPALMFDPSRRQIRALATASAAMAAGCGFLAVDQFSTEDSIFVIAVLIFGVVFFGLGSLALGSSAIRGIVALVPEGLLVPSLGAVFIPWGVVRKVAVFDFAGVPMIAVDVSDPKELRGPWRSRALIALNRLLMRLLHSRWEVWDVWFSATLLGSGPDVFSHAVDYYLRHPDDRQRIGSELPPGLAASPQGS